MKTYLDCIPCFIRQGLELARMVTEDPVLQERLMRESLKMAAGLNFSDSPPALAQKMHRLAREISGIADPYYDVKKKFNRFALDLYPELDALVKKSPDPFETAVRLAIAGNIIDFGVKMALKNEDVHDSIDHSMKDDLDLDAVRALQIEIQNASSILYLGDNAGEIVLDRLLIELLPREKVSFVVKGAPIINDALMEDAREAGIADLVEVIDNGADVPGTILSECSGEFQKRFAAADLIIAKGQGNYETLSSEDKNIFFLLKAKCPVIARDIGCELGNIVILNKMAASVVPF
jgi:damage-control phosphatase, subfamily I